MRWILIAIVLAVAAGLLSAYVPASMPGEEARTTTWHPHVTGSGAYMYTTDTTPPQTTPSPTAEAPLTMLFKAGYWALRVSLGPSNGSLTVTYLGSQALYLENPLLPLTAGLQLTLRYTDGSETVVRKPGARHWNTTVEIGPGESSSMGFNAEGLSSIKVEGSLPDGTPVELSIPLRAPPCRGASTVTMLSTVTVTETVCGCTETHTAETPACIAEHVASYPEPPAGEVRRLEEPGATIHTDGVVEISAPAEVRGRWININMTNLWNTPVRPATFYTEFTIINASTDGTNYFGVGWTGVYAATVTTPLIPGSCLEQVGNHYPIYADSILEPGETAKIVGFRLPENLDFLQGVGEAWLYIRATVKYQPVADVYKIRVPDDPSYSYLEHFLLVQLYRERSMEIVFRVHVYLASE